MSNKLSKVTKVSKFFHVFILVGYLVVVYTDVLIYYKPRSEECFCVFLLSYLMMW